MPKLGDGGDEEGAVHKIVPWVVGQVGVRAIINVELEGHRCVPVEWPVQHLAGAPVILYVKQESATRAVRTVLPSLWVDASVVVGLEENAVMEVSRKEVSKFLHDSRDR